MIARRVRILILGGIGVAMAIAAGVYAVHVQRARVAALANDRGAPPASSPEIGDLVGHVVSIDAARDEITIDYGRSRGAAFGMTVGVWREGPKEPADWDNTVRLGTFELVSVGEHQSRARRFGDRIADFDIAGRDNSGHLEPARQIRPGDSVSNRTEPASFRVVQLGTGDDPRAIEALTRNRLETARSWLGIAGPFSENGSLSQDRYLNASRMVMDAERDAATSRAEEIAAIEAHLKRVTLALERICNTFVIDGEMPNGPNSREARAYQAEAALMLAKARRGKGLAH